MQDCRTYVALLYAKLCNHKNEFKGSTTTLVLKLQIDTLKANLCSSERMESVCVTERKRNFKEFACECI
jgi:hypothetical protein